MSFPTTSSDTFLTPVDRHAAAQVTGESHTVGLAYPYSAELTELPQRETISVSGYTEVAYAPQAATEFQVDYGSGTLYFYSSAAGATISVNYMSLGSVLRASTVAQIQSALQTIQAILFNMQAATNFGLKDFNEFQMKDRTTGEYRTLVLDDGAFGVAPSTTTTTTTTTTT